MNVLLPPLNSPATTTRNAASSRTSEDSGELGREEEVEVGRESRIGNAKMREAKSNKGVSV